MLTLLQRFFRSAVAPAVRPAPRCSTLEALESRIAPAGLLTFAKGTLLFKGLLESDLTFTQTVVDGAGGVTVKTQVSTPDGPLGNAFSGVKNIVVKPTNTETSEGRFVTLNLVQLAGNVQVFAPKLLPVYLTVNGDGMLSDQPQIGGNLQLTGGDQYDSILLHNVQVGGGVNLTGKGGGNGVFVDGTTKVGKNLTATEVATLQLQPGAEVGGNLLLTQKSGLFSDSIELGNGATIGGNVSLYGGPSATSVNAYANVEGRFFLSAGAGYNTVNVAMMAKSFSYLGGASNDDLWFYKTSIAESVTINGVAGNNRVIFDVGGVQSLLGDMTVGKNLKVQGGAGMDLVYLDSALRKLTVGGNVSASLSHGTNIIKWNGQMNGRSITINTGSGGDGVVFTGLQAANATFTGRFGDGADTVQLSPNFKLVSLDGQGGVDVVKPNGLAPAISKFKRFESVS